MPAGHCALGDGVALIDAVPVVDGVALADAVVVVDDEHDAHTVSDDEVQSATTAQPAGQLVHAAHAAAPGRLENVAPTHTVQTAEPPAPCRAPYLPATHTVHSLACERLL